MTKCNECGKSFKNVASHKSRAHGKKATRGPELEPRLTFEQLVDNYWLEMELPSKLAILALAAKQLAI